MQKHEVLLTFGALRKSCEKHNSRLLTKTLQVTTKALGFKMIEGVKKIGFALLDILGLPISNAHTVATHKMTPLAPSIQSTRKPSDWSIHALSALGSRHLVPKPHSNNPKPIVWDGISYVAIEGFGLGWEVAPLPCLDFGWGHLVQPILTSTSTEGADDLEEK